MQILNGRRHRVESLAFSPCGRWLAAGNAGGCHIWDTSNPTTKPKQLEENFRYVHDLAFRPNGDLFFCDASHKCYLTDPVKIGARPVGKQAGSLVMAPDGDRFIAVGWKSLTSLTLGKREEFVKNLHRDSVTAASDVFVGAFSADGTMVATVEGVHGGPDPFLVIRSADTMKQLGGTPTYRGPGQLLFSHDGTKLFVRAAASIASYDVSDPQKSPRKIVNPSRKHFVAMAAHPEGKLLTTDNDALVQIWDMTTLTAVRTIEWSIGGLYAVAVSRDGTRAATGGSKGKVLVWDWD